ncbi:MAG: prolipoprotein diacylglyceryl transferase [Fimbriimonadaceae bacterium]|nr:prolipoprotein diacylglyceryl transferase [Fimbriimonadaceae bacterium]QYK57571.1 MAG: prolipoprotein diacylglyceryl transferase [Fimbriimonadaceae bacterium]
MFPELISQPVPIRSFGVMMVVAVLVAVWISQRRAPQFGLKKEAVWDAALWMVLPGILGARLAYILLNWSSYAGKPQEILSLRFEGLTSFGGLVLGFVGLLVWARRSGTPLWPFLDTVAPGVLAAQAIGRVGCLLNGCCYGRPTEAWFGVHFHGQSAKHVPAQIVDTFLMLGAALAIVLWERRGKAAVGQAFALMIVGYGLSRFVYEFFRAGTVDEMRAGIASSAFLGALPVTGAQLFALAMAALGVILYFSRVAKKSGAVTAQPT